MERGDSERTVEERRKAEGGNKPPSMRDPLLGKANHTGRHKRPVEINKLVNE